MSAIGQQETKAVTKNFNIGKVLRLSSTVVDVQFSEQSVPEISYKLIILRSEKNSAASYAAALTQQKSDFNLINLEVAQHLGDGIVRCIALEPLDGIRRGLDVIDTGAPIEVPIGPNVLGRVFDAI